MPRRNKVELQGLVDRIVEMFYKQNLSQREIAETLKAEGYDVSKSGVGRALVDYAGQMKAYKEAAMEAALGEIPENVAKFIKEITCPWLYVDDMIGTSLIFLLGAVFFKKGKTVKTFMAWTIFAIITSIVFTPLIEPWSKELLNATTAGDFEAIFQLSIFRHAALIDTVNDTIVNIALFTAIWFRIKTLKH